MTNSTQTKFQEYTQYLLDAFTTSTRSQDEVINQMAYQLLDYIDNNVEEEE